MAFRFNWRRWIDTALILLLITEVFAVRLPIVTERKIMPAGDAFNFHYIASHLMRFDYPKQEKRLPVYPMFLVGGRLLGLDPIRTSIGVSLAASAGIVVILYLLGREFGIARWVLLFVLGLSVYDPLLTINAIRPLSDSLFVFWILVSVLAVTRLMRYPPETVWHRSLWLTGLALVLMMFTRYEGFLIAGLLGLSLFLRLSWRQVLVVAILPAATILLWIPVFLYVHGSLSHLGYVTDATSSSGGFGEISGIPENFQKLMSGAGWQRIWATPASELTQEHEDQAALRVLSSGAWWLSIFSFLGLVWLIIRHGRVALPLLLMAAGYMLLLSWWWVYSRYVAPLSVVFYLGVAAGVYALVEGLSRFHFGRAWQAIVKISFVVILTLIIFQQGPVMYSSALSRSWEGNGKGYALYQAIQFVGRQNKPVFAPADYPMTLFVFGSYGQPRTSMNHALGLYLTSYSGLDTDAAYQDITSKKISSLLIPYQDERVEKMRELVAHLKDSGYLGKSRRFESTRWDTRDVEQVDVYDLVW